MTIKLGFIGTGSIAFRHLGHLSKMADVEITAFCSKNVYNAMKAAESFPGARAYARLDDMLDGASLDGVYVCVPPDVHGESEWKLIERSIPFLVEKPLGLDRSVTSKILSAVRSKNLLTAVGYHWRYSQATQIARGLLADRRIGMAIGSWIGSMPMTGWWRRQSASGGQFVEQTTHLVDLLRYICGEVQEVYASYALRVMQEQLPGTDVPDVGTVSLKLRSGVIASISNACMVPVSRHRIGLELLTDQGALMLEEERLHHITARETHVYSNDTPPLASEAMAFVQALRTGDRSLILSDYEDACRTHDITMAANESAASGKPVCLQSGNIF